MTSGEDQLFDEVYEESLKPKEERVFSVGTYLSLLNIGLKNSGSRRIKGEVSSLKVLNGYLLFSLKDKEDESILNFFMWRRDYDLSGVDLEVGMEVIAYGYPSIYSRRGELRIQTQTIELVGEGALKKAYDELKARLMKEGVFDEERKRPLPEFPKEIGVVTSLSGGTVIHDFESNLGKFGFRIKAIDARVEGKQAVKSLLSALKRMEREDIDVLVVIRGGGAIEALQCFDNEALVRAVAAFPVPVLAGIGHHKDVTLAALAADRMASTPQGAAEILNESWENARHSARIYEQKIFSSYLECILETKDSVNRFSNELGRSFRGIFENFRRLETGFLSGVDAVKHLIASAGERMENAGESMISGFARIIDRSRENLDSFGEAFFAFDPKRQLELGYSIVSMKGKVIRRVKEVKEKEQIDIRMSDGIIGGEVVEVKKKDG